MKANTAKSFDAPLRQGTPVLSKRFTVHLDDGWFLLTRLPDRYRAVPISGFWTVLGWRLRVNARGVWDAWLRG